MIVLHAFIYTESIQEDMNMKKSLKIFLSAVTISLFLTGCASDRNHTNTNTGSVSAAVKDTDSSKILILYFDQGENSDGAGENGVDAITSASLANGIPDGIENNDIRVMKDEIAKVTGGDTYGVHIQETYKPSYEEMVDQAREDQNDDKQFTFKEDLPDLSKYDVIFVGMPVWWSKLPQPMMNVFEQLDFSNKTIIPFGINLGSGFGQMIDQIKEMEPQAKVSDDGLTITGDTTNADAVKDVDDWLAGEGY